MIFSVVLSAVFALVFFAAGKIVKADIDYKKALAITSVRSAAVIPFMLAGFYIMFTAKNRTITEEENAKPE